MLYGEVGEAAQSNGLLDDGEGGTDHGLAGHTCCRSCKHECELHTATQVSHNAGEASLQGPQGESIGFINLWFHFTSGTKTEGICHACACDLLEFAW